MKINYLNPKLNSLLNRTTNRQGLFQVSPFPIWQLFPVTLVFTCSWRVKVMLLSVFQLDYIHTRVFSDQCSRSTVCARVWECFEQCSSSIIYICVRVCSDQCSSSIIFMCVLVCSVQCSNSIIMYTCICMLWSVFQLNYMCVCSDQCSSSIIYICVCALISVLALLYMCMCMCDHCFNYYNIYVCIYALISSPTLLYTYICMYVCSNQCYSSIIIYTYVCTLTNYSSILYI